jgi:hypothetical protein
LYCASDAFEPPRIEFDFVVEFDNLRRAPSHGRPPVRLRKKVVLSTALEKNYHDWQGKTIHIGRK